MNNENYENNDLEIEEVDKMHMCDSRKEITELQKEVAVLKAEMSSVKTDLSSIKQDIKDIKDNNKREFKEVREKMSTMIISGLASTVLILVGILVNTFTK